MIINDYMPYSDAPNPNQDPESMNIDQCHIIYAYFPANTQPMELPYALNDSS
jgi:hypothetical protein